MSVSWWLSGSSSRCHGVVCSLWLWYFLIILTYYFRSAGCSELLKLACAKCMASLLVDEGRDDPNTTISGPSLARHRSAIFGISLACWWWPNIECWLESFVISGDLDQYSVIFLCFVVRFFMSLLVLQSSWWGRESWLLCLVCLPGVSWLLSGFPCDAMG